MGMFENKKVDGNTWNPASLKRVRNLWIRLNPYNAGGD